MDDTWVPRRRRPVSRVRDRQRRRRQREQYRAANPGQPPARQVLQVLQEMTLPLRDALWHLGHTRVAVVLLTLITALVLLVYAGWHVVQERIFPGVRVAGVYVGGMTGQEAAAALQLGWDEDVVLRLVDRDRYWEATPADLGMTLNSEQAVAAARRVGMAGIPLGWDVEATIETDYIIAQSYLLDLVPEVEVAPANARFSLESRRLVGVRGREGQLLEVGQTMANLINDSAGAVNRRQLELVTRPLVPDVIDPAPHLEAVRDLIRHPFRMVGYDPYLDEPVVWETTTETFVSWIEVDEFGLTLREESFLPFFHAQNASLNPPRTPDPRYLDRVDTLQKMRRAIAGNSNSVQLRVRYRPTHYTVERGDRGFFISRKTGIPYFLIEEVNRDYDMDFLYPGDVLNLPSRDVAVPLDPVLNKRIIVDLTYQRLTAYENGQPVFRWNISSGIEDNPTTPGIYQILTHDEVAHGSSFNLCGAQGCGQWKMNWFMGVYEVRPGLMNGFHGAVVLPNGSLLNHGLVGVPATFGCIMSVDDNARSLYDWAEVGTLVEIISDDYRPRSELARQARAATEAEIFA